MDLLITPSGDLAFTEINSKNKRLSVNFFKSMNNALKIDFDIEGNYQEHPQKDTFVIKFNISHKLKNKRAEIVKDDAYKMQQVLIRLKTSLGELPERLTIGSMLEIVKHKNLNDEHVRLKVENIVSTAINGILSDFKVVAKPEINKDNGYKQIMNIKIYENNELLTTYTMEG